MKNILQQYKFNSETGILKGISDGLELKVNARHRNLRGKSRLFLTTNEKNPCYVSGLFSTGKLNSYSLSDRNGNYFLLNLISENKAEIVREAPALIFKKNIGEIR